VLGREHVLRQNPFDCPSGHSPGFQTSPQVAAKNEGARIEALTCNRGFIETYRDALLGHMAGLASVLFHFGTYWVLKFGKVACEAAEGDRRFLPSHLNSPGARLKSDGKRVRPSRAMRQLAPAVWRCAMLREGVLFGVSVDGIAGHSTIYDALHSHLRTTLEGDSDVCPVDNFRLTRREPRSEAQAGIH
jgi:hypothetical protein